jgi:site-specific DNA-methyltransferase (adenine-specific)
VTKTVIGGATLFHAPMEEVIRELDSVSHIFTDPPYLYLKNQEFDRPFDEEVLFENAKRILPDSGFIALFGRGTSFYRWNTRLAEMGFVFKEEIVWDKRYTSSCCNALSRVHETVSVHTKKTGKIRRTKIPYIEQKQFYIASIVNDIKRIKSAINTEAGLNRILVFLQEGLLYEHEMATKHCVTQTKMKEADRAVTTVNRVSNGIYEKSIIEVKPNRHKYSHPTEKPVRLAERIIALISDPGDTIFDPFMGSGSFGVACLNTGRNYIGSEISEKYYRTAVSRIQQCVSENVSLFVPPPVMTMEANP